jgi:hypothetical protein
MPYNKVYRKPQIKLEVLNMIAKQVEKQLHVFCLIDSNFQSNYHNYNKNNSNWRNYKNIV